MRYLIFILGLTVLLSACESTKTVTLPEEKPVYYWNESAGRAHEGRCYQQVVGPDPIVESKRCGR